MEAITRQNHLPRHKDEQDDSRLHHPVDKSRKQLRLVTVEGTQRRSEERFKIKVKHHGDQVRFLPAELLVGQNQSFQSDREAHVTAGHHVLDLELQEAGGETEFLHHPGVFPGRQARLLLTARAQTQT